VPGGYRLRLIACACSDRKPLSPLRSSPRHAFAERALGVEGVHPPFNGKRVLFAAAALAGINVGAGTNVAGRIAQLALLEPELVPVVVPDFILLCSVLPDFILLPVAPGPTLPSLDAPGAGCICADAIVVAPNSAATTRVEIASLDRMGISC